MIQIIPRQVIHLVLDIFSAGMFLVHNMSVSDSKYLQFSDRLVCVFIFYCFHIKKYSKSLNFDRTSPYKAVFYRKNFSSLHDIGLVIK